MHPTTNLIPHSNFIIFLLVDSLGQIFFTSYNSEIVLGEVSSPSRHRLEIEHIFVVTSVVLAGLLVIFSTFCEVIFFYGTKPLLALIPKHRLIPPSPRNFLDISEM